MAGNMIVVTFRDHQNKSAGLYQSLMMDARFKIVPLGEPADILLIDHDATAYYRQIIDTYKAIGTKIVLYPHGATAHLAWDGVWPVYDKVDAFLAMSEGQAETMHRYGYPKPVYVTGWHWCEIKPFRRSYNKRILFAPIHALNNGFLHPEVKRLNGRVHDALAKTAGKELSVRYMGDLDIIGIKPDERVEYHRGAADNSYHDIDTADLVVSFETFAYLSIARGKPTVMYRQEIPYFDGHDEQSIRYAKHWKQYGDFMRYPVTIGQDGLVSGNAFDPDQIAEWKQLFIGEPMPEGRLGDILESIHA